ncbi:hypothetical protein LQ327_32840 [Actinomycetospora endophytica]|uniref:Uncharacterized protein n=1 Tax=Actinomycetospora endophytica TaxID=2291215 RepID=A0ABS8PIQ8_9PSEU|nr:hypothetical protein [Actinomycetospora endophytica]MCD2198168.1 hypothetical protein [Actinomycetospora endophytica]
MIRPVELYFGVPTDAEPTRILVSTLPEFEAVVDLVELLALDQGAAIQLDLHPVGVAAGRPILVQLLIGDPERSRVLVHEDGAVFAAIDDRVGRLDRDVGFTHVRDPGAAEPDETRIGPRTAVDAVVFQLLTGDRFPPVRWLELVAD